MQRRLSGASVRHVLCSIELPVVAYGLLRRHLGDAGLDRFEDELGVAITSMPQVVSPDLGQCAAYVRMVSAGGQSDNLAAWGLAPVPPTHLDAHQAEAMLHLVDDLGPDGSVVAAGCIV